MPFQIVRQDIVRMQADAIVNTANPLPRIGSGVDQRIHEAAGPLLLQARQTIGAIQPGDAAITPGYSLPCKYVIHAVGPSWQGGDRGETVLLRSCYSRSLFLARQWGCQSIAFPLISSGNYGFPKEVALRVATDAISAFLEENEMQVYLVVYDRESLRVSESLHYEVTRYIHNHQVREYSPDYSREVFSAPAPMSAEDARPKSRRPGISLPKIQRPKKEAPPPDPAVGHSIPVFPTAAPSAPYPASTPVAAPVPLSFTPDAGFSETLLKLIDKTGKKDSEIYKKANLSKQHFSKIRNNPDYKPTKPTAIALAIALELDLEQTRDLIGRAGFALTKSSVFDLIIMFFIEQHNYNVMDINITLYEFDQPLLGS